MSDTGRFCPELNEGNHLLGNGNKAGSSVGELTWICHRFGEKSTRRAVMCPKYGHKRGRPRSPCTKHGVTSSGMRLGNEPCAPSAFLTAPQDR